MGGMPTALGWGKIASSITAKQHDSGILSSDIHGCRGRRWAPCQNQVRYMPVDKQRVEPSLPCQSRGAAATNICATTHHIQTMVAGGSPTAAGAAKLRACMGSQASKLNKVIGILRLYFMSLIQCCIHIYTWIRYSFEKELMQNQKRMNFFGCSLQGMNKPRTICTEERASKE
jgi:hypothetical protein